MTELSVVGGSVTEQSRGGLDLRRLLPTRRLGLLTGSDASAIWTGIGFIVAGFVLIAVAWAGAAGHLLVSLQVPYLISGGLGGVGLIVVGGLVVVVTVVRQAADQRARQTQTLIDAVRALNERMAEPPPPSRRSRKTE